ncbi:MAG: YraN family protein [Alphaproteobacteria bacterium]|nr:YraN family protein [Alphaproteobacteria bacterium]
MTRARRVAAEARGRRGERLAALRLGLAGYTILARREKNPFGEIDLIARRGRVVVFVEVKAHAAVGPNGPVGARQQARIARAAEAFLARRRDLAGLDVRFDLVVVAPWRWPRHVMDAWRP